MSVALDMTFANRNRGGSGVYARSLLAALRDRTDVTPWAIEGPRRSNVVGTMRWLTRGARRELDARPPDILHCPSFVAPWAVKVPTVITVHDAAGSRYPQDHPLEWQVYARGLMPRRLRAAARIITGSEFSRRELVEVYGLRQERVIVVPYGLDRQFLDYSPAAESRRSDVILFPGAPIGRKNLEAVLRAMAGAGPATTLARATLEISGARASDFPRHAEAITMLGLADRVRWLGNVRFAELPALYASATVVAYPSLYEGFGFPPLEAMAVGTPVVTSNRGSLPEVAPPETAIVVDPTDPEALAGALEQVLTDEGLRCRLREKGLAQARTFTWASCAERTVQVYGQVLAESSEAQK